MTSVKTEAACANWEAVAAEVGNDLKKVIDRDSAVACGQGVAVAEGAAQTITHLAERADDAKDVVDVGQAIRDASRSSDVSVATGIQWYIARIACATHHAVREVVCQLLVGAKAESTIWVALIGEAVAVIGDGSTSLTIYAELIRWNHGDPLKASSDGPSASR